MALYLPHHCLVWYAAVVDVRFYYYTLTVLYGQPPNSPLLNFILHYDQIVWFVALELSIQTKIIFSILESFLILWPATSTTCNTDIIS